MLFIVVEPNSTKKRYRKSFLKLSSKNHSDRNQKPTAQEDNKNRNDPIK